ncbi:hypothetical protein [Candidatus Pelagibacter sp.]|uniref:hypothetical protein n=1 Tax=Candidatus Pelagibacter sp. TaxID=2024849 RepID=UPI003F85D32A
MKLNCKICNKKFIRTHSRQKYCSKECARVPRLEYFKIYNKSDKAKEIRENYYKSDRAKEYIKKRNNLPEVKALKRKWAQSDKGKKYQKEYQKKFMQSEEGKKWRRNYDKNYRKSEKVKEYHKEYQKKYVESGKMKIARAKYNKSEKGRETVNNYMNTKYNSDPLFKVIVNIRNRLGKYIRIKNIKKEHKTFEIIGCKPEYLKKYLEKKFYPHPSTNEEMTWENYSLHGWHIDHIIPLDSAKNKKDLEKLAHYSNLQPLWSMENWKKKNKY